MPDKNDADKVDPDKDDVRLVYDKECPICDLYCRKIGVDESAGRLVRIDARESSPIMDEITAQGLDIDEGMVVKIGDRLYYGSEAIHELALLSSKSGFLDRFAHLTFRSKRMAKVLYPLLRSCRNLLLKILGRSRINNLGQAGKDRF